MRQQTGNIYIRYEPASGLIGFILKNYNYPIIINDPEALECWRSTSEKLSYIASLEENYGEHLRSKPCLVVIDDIQILRDMENDGFKGNFIFCAWNRGRFDGHEEFCFSEKLLLRHAMKTASGLEYFIDSLDSIKI